MPTKKEHEAARARGKRFYDELLEAQGGGCAICGRAPATRRLCVDHDHKTLEVRGLLCYLCNYFIGRAGVSPTTLMAAAAYLRNPPARALLEQLESGEE